MTLEQKLKELEDNGYDLHYEESIMCYYEVEVDQNATHLIRYFDSAFDDGEHYTRFIDHAYGHLQQKIEMTSLQVLPSDIYDYIEEAYQLSLSINHAEVVDLLRVVMKRVRQHNISTDEISI